MPCSTTALHPVTLPPNQMLRTHPPCDIRVFAVPRATNYILARPTIPTIPTRYQACQLNRSMAMNTPSAPTDPTPDGTSDSVSDAAPNPPFDADLHDLAVEIAVNTGVSLAPA